MKLNYLCIGHCCHDKTDDKDILGGTVSYAAILAKAWNVKSGILTSVSKDFKFLDKFKRLDIPLTIKWANQTTTFENRYADGKRTQYLLARAETIDKNDLLEKFQKVPIVHFGPIANEINPNILTAFPHSLKGLSIQGLLRQWAPDGLVSPRAMDWTILNEIDIVFLSDEDISGVEDYLEKIIQNCKQVVLTHGSNGATIFENGQKLYFPSFPVKEVDPTGAGDTFTTTYLIDYYKNKNVRSACIFAHCAASFIVESKGLSKIPRMEEVQRRCREYPDPT